MRKITQSAWDKIPAGYKDVWTSDAARGTNYNGRLTWLTSSDGGTVLLIEGESFVIVPDDETEAFAEKEYFKAHPELNP